MLRRIWENRNIYLFLFPALIVLVIFGYYPAIEAFTLSVTDGMGNFVGLDNFIRMVSDEILIGSVWNMIILLIVGLITSNIPALFMAEMLYNLKSKRISSVYRFLLIIPMLIPGVVIMLVWQYMIFDPTNGLLNALFVALGMEPLGWLGEISTALLSLMLVGFPWISGTNLLIYLAGLQSIPDSVIESCKLDGANIIVRFFKIDLPLLVGQFKLLLILGIINGIQAFQLQLMTTEGGPAYSTMVPGLWMYQRAFRFSDFGYASAIGLIMFFVILFFSYLNIKFIDTK